MMEENKYFPEDQVSEEPEGQTTEPSDQLSEQPQEQPSSQLPTRITNRQEQSSEQPKYDYHYSWGDGPDGQYEPGGPGSYPPPYRGMQAPQPANGFMTAALIMGILSLIFAFISGIGGIFLGSLGIIFAILSRGDERMSFQSKLGIGLSAGGMFFGTAIFLLLSLVISRGAFQTEFENELKRYGIGSELPEDGDDYDFYKNFIEDGGSGEDLPGV